MTRGLSSQWDARAREGGAILVLALGFGLLAWLGIEWTRNEQHIATVWLPNALLVAALLRMPRRSPAAVLPACCAANVGAAMFAGVPISQCGPFAIINVIEVAIVIAIARRGSARALDLADLGDLARFSVAGVVGPLLSGLLATLVVLAARFSLDWRVWLTWSGAHILQLLIATPLAISLVDGWRNRRALTAAELTRGASILVACLFGSIALFDQSRFPLLFLACPFVIGAAFRLGTIGTAMAIAIISTVATIATALGHGPIMLDHGSLLTQLLVLQLFLATNFVMGLPVAAMLKGLAQTRAELRESRDFARSMLENMREVIFRTDRDGRWVFLNPAWEQLTGYPVAESLGWRTTRLLHPDDIAATREVYPRIANGELSEAMLRQRFHSADGECHHIEVSIRALRDEQGRFTGTTGSIRDVTERVNAAEALADREAQLALLAKNATDAVFRLDLDGVCLYASPSVREVIGVEPRLLAGHDMLTRFHPDDAEAVLATYRALKAGEIDRTIITYRSEPLDRSGTWRWLEANCGLVRDAAGAPQEIIVSIRDVSERKALEFELKDARDAAQVAADAKASFLANMSHEIRTPMNGVIGFTELLLDSELTAEQRSHAHLIADSGQAMMRLLNDILDLSKIEAGQMQIAREPLDLRHALRGCVKLIGPIARRNGIEFHGSFDARIPSRIIGDGLRIRQIILNLLGNALKFTDYGSIALHAAVLDQADGQRLLIEVSDTGIGIPPERREAIFEQFVQSDLSVARRYGGTGLGLAISNELARLMNGELTLTSEEGLGTTFFLKLPLEIAEVTAPAKKVSADAAPTAPAAEPGERPRVLLAEDHDINELLTTEMLGRLGCEVEVARDGAEAIDRIVDAEARGEPFRLVLMDVQMPIVDGIEATRRVRASGVTAERLPIVALTANAYADDVEACLAAGMQAHLAKPVRMRELHAMLSRWTSAAPATAAPAPSPRGLKERFLTRKEATLERIATMIRNGQFADADMEELARMLHKLAGTAGLFGEAALGERAADVEDAIPAWPADQRAKRLADALDRLRAAA